MTPQLISVQGFAFHGRPLSLLVALAPAGSHLFHFSRRSLRLAIQSTAKRNETNKTICTITKKTNHSSNRLMNGSFFTWAQLLLSQPLYYESRCLNGNRFVHFGCCLFYALAGSFYFALYCFRLFLYALS